MQQVNIHEAKPQFSPLIAAVEQGEEIVIARYGQPIAKLGSYPFNPSFWAAPINCASEVIKTSTSSSIAVAR